MCPAGPRQDVWHSRPRLCSAVFHHLTQARAPVPHNPRCTILMQRSKGTACLCRPAGPGGCRTWAWTILPASFCLTPSGFSSLCPIPLSCPSVFGCPLTAPPRTECHTECQPPPLELALCGENRESRSFPLNSGLKRPQTARIIPRRIPSTLLREKGYKFRVCSWLPPEGRTRQGARHPAPLAACSLGIPRPNRNARRHCKWLQSQNLHPPKGPGHLLSATCFLACAYSCVWPATGERPLRGMAGGHLSGFPRFPQPASPRSPGP